MNILVEQKIINKIIWEDYRKNNANETCRDIVRYYQKINNFEHFSDSKFQKNASSFIEKHFAPFDKVTMYKKELKKNNSTWEPWMKHLKNYNSFLKKQIEESLKNKNCFEYIPIKNKPKTFAKEYAKKNEYILIENSNHFFEILKN